MCGIVKPKEDFYWKNKTEGKLQPRCKTCFGLDSNEEKKRKEDAEFFNKVNQLWR